MGLSTYLIGLTFLRTRQVGELYFSQNGMKPYGSVCIFRKFECCGGAHCCSEWTELSCGID